MMKQFTVNTNPASARDILDFHHDGSTQTFRIPALLMAYHVQQLYLGMA
jgi:hypothetical protein